MSSNKINKSVEETFVKKTQLEHIIDIPDTYIGSVEKTDVDTWIYNDEDEKIIYKNIKYIPGLYKIFDEVLVNAIDQHVRTEHDEKITNKVNTIKVNFDINNNIITVYNNGEGIPVVEHKEHNVWVPELIFGHLLTSSNYDKNEKKITGGKNGYGAKLANIFSKTFKIETVDAERKLKYVQVFEKNMTIKGMPIITKCNTKPYTIIEFSPDLERFGIDKLDDDTLLLMKKRVIDITACTNKNVSVFLNDKKLDCKTLEKYVNYYLDQDIEKVYEEVCDRWEVVVAINPDTKFEHVSFVNGISTVKGGKHVDYVSNSIVKKVQTYLSTKGIKRKKIDLKPAHIKDNIFIFIRSTIENPAFDSQIKEYLTTPSTKFGSKCEVSDKFIEKLIKTTLINRAMKLSDFKDNLGLQKVSGKKTTAIRGIDKLDDANKAGTNESSKCTLILTEGDSAKALAIAGLSVVGRDYYGVFPLRGKVLNVRDVTLKKVSDNNEINNLVKIMGLKFDSKKKDKNETLQDLRYGRIMIFTDADVDGSHIKGLIINLFAIFWPELLEIPGFIISLATPILKVKKNKESIEFYTMTEFNNWKQSIENIKNWDIKYYKGLGTSTSDEAKGYFTNFEDKNICYMINDKDDDDINKELSFDKIELAFDKKRSEDRKSWLKTYDKDNIIEQNQKKILYHEFIDKELIHFSDYDCKRSLPCICDGLKPSLRKIIYSCFKRNLKKEIKVAQLAGYISENSAYHHGEQSLYDSIIGLAQDYVGSNNIELLEPKGQFGCLSPETPILMWNGSIKRADEIIIGDKLIGDDGLERNVLKITSGIDDMYEINCGDTKYIVNSQHIITLYYTSEYSSDNTYDNKIDIKLDDYLKLSSISKNKLYMISNTNCINWEYQKVSYEPYHINEIYINKDIPKEYIYNDKETRLKVLAGYVDKYGILKNDDKNYYYEISLQYDIICSELINSLDFICKSLGFSTKKLDKRLSIYGKTINEIPVLLEKNRIDKNMKTVMIHNFKKFTVTYLGKNNFNGWMIDNNERFLLGNFIVTHNSRIAGGHDSASPRYIFTNLSELTFHIFNPLDNPLLEYNEDDGKKIEPLWYIPILPLILVNGSEGIGTGFSTKIPPHDPELIVKNLFNLMNNKPFERMIPWFRGFRGSIEFKGINDYGLEQYINKGIYKIIDDTTILIEELPIGKWTDDYKSFLETLLYDKSLDNKANKQCLVDFSNNSTEKIVRYTLKLKKEDLNELNNNGNIENIFKLTDCKYTNYSNMHLYNSKGIICKYETIEDIMKEFYSIRLVYYAKRKEYMLKTMQKELDIYQAKIRFIEEFISGEINILHKEDDEIYQLLNERNYPKFGNNDNDIDENDDNSSYSYEYLLNMKIKSLTKKKVDELKKLHENKLAIYNDLLLKSEKDIWKDDLNKFLDVYRKKIKEYDDKINEQIKTLNMHNSSVKKSTKKK
jgi:DNA gyrase/topoisomerase IV subunit B